MYEALLLCGGPLSMACLLVWVLTFQAHNVISTCKTQGEEAGSVLVPISVSSHVGMLQPIIEELVTAASGTGSSKALVRGGSVTLPCY